MGGDQTLYKFKIINDTNIYPEIKYGIANKHQQSSLLMCQMRVI